MKYSYATSLYFATSLAFNAPRWRDSPGTISVEFYTEVKVCLTCKMAKKYCRKFQPLSRVHERYRRQTNDRRICDSHVRVKMQQM